MKLSAVASVASLLSGQVDAGSCDGCEMEIHALNNAFYDLEGFGIRFVASPRHAHVLTVTRDMKEAAGAELFGDTRSKIGRCDRRAGWRLLSPAATPLLAA
jgi:hypothetical protein